MKTKINILFLLLFLLVSYSHVSAQVTVRAKADSLYNLMAYHDAIEQYKYLWNHDSNDTESLYKLADCYRLTNDMKNACKTYKIIVDMDLAEPLQLFYYALALLETGDRTAAARVMSQYKEDERGANYTKALAEYESFFDDSACYRIEALPFNSKAQDFSPAILGKQIVYVSSRERAQLFSYSHTWSGDPYYRMYVTSKNEDGTYARPKRFAPCAEKRFNNGPAAFDPTGSTMMLTRNNVRHGSAVKAADGKIKLMLVEYTYDAASEKWKEVGEFTYSRSEYNFAHAAYSEDGMVLYFSSDMPGSMGGMDLWYCVRGEKGWEKPINAGTSINTPGNEIFPSVNNGKLFYSSDGLSGIGGLDLYEANTNKLGLPTGMPLNMGYPLNSQGDDFGITFSRNGKKGYFSSNRKTLDGNDDIYEFTVVNEPLRGIRLRGICKDSRTLEILPGALVYLKNAAGDTLARDTADEAGAYNFALDFDKKYKISASTPRYYDGVSQITAPSYGKQKVLNVVTSLEKDPGTILVITLKDAKTGALLNTATAKQAVNSDTTYFKASDTGTIRIAIPNTHFGQTIEVPLIFQCQNYFEKGTTVTAQVTAEGEIPVTELLSQPEVGLDVGKMINIMPIYFDLNSSKIRPDAALELDKVAAIMQEYPGMVIELGSYTDCRSSASYNLELSDRRAKSSAKYIISKGISKKRIYGKGYGESKPVNRCECEGDRTVPCTEEEHQMNRRTEFIIVKMK